MDTLLDFIVTLLKWCHKHLDQITLSIITVMLVFFGLTLGKYLQRVIGQVNIILRVIILALVYMIFFGLFINYIPGLIKDLLTQLNDYSLFPLLLIIIVFIGIIADKR